MPNLQPPITQVAQALAYHQKLSEIAPKVKFLMALFLHPSLNAGLIAEAARSGVIYGVDDPNPLPRSCSLTMSTGQDVTTNSQDGVLDIEQYYPVFEAMQANNLVLNLHGESPGISVLEAEAAFMPTLFKLHDQFPRLRIVLEHVSTQKGVDAVWRCGETV
ncbi:MAG: hypothetical protein Q9183_006431 [Haloplaca sp. 2 TL-2023]